MSAPRQIKYRGQIYKLAYEGYPHAQPPELKASPHERCPAGTHWNEHDKRCKPLPPELAALTHTANNRTGIAKLYSKQSSSRFHHMAAQAHDIASAAARKHGFPEVMDNHARRAEYHRRKAAQPATPAHPDWPYKRKARRTGAAPHKKCPKGTHWNDQQHKCLPLPRSLQGVSADAHRYSKGVEFMGKLMTPVGREGKKQHAESMAGLHAKANHAHHRAKRLAERKGFTELAQQHRKVARKHAKQMEQHWQTYDKLS